jgi:hypothetical protein
MAAPTPCVVRRRKYPKGFDALSYASGYIEGQAQRAKRPLRVITSPKVSKDAP